MCVTNVYCCWEEKMLGWRNFWELSLSSVIAILADGAVVVAHFSNVTPRGFLPGYFFER